uniref:Rieske domain-containing protein n=1 Tax=Coturnix japonica TaxID=93934 RepID=A0A8C2TJS6_COTJA
MGAETATGDGLMGEMLQREQISAKGKGCAGRKAGVAMVTAAMLAAAMLAATIFLVEGAPPWLWGADPSSLLCPRLCEVMVAGYPVLLVRNKMEFRALGSRCPHYGAPLSKGVLRGHRLRCPWHGSCFNIRTGDIEEYPSLDSLPCFKVISGPLPPIKANPPSLELELPVHKYILLSPLPGHSGRWKASLVGVAALTCAETLRQEGFTGRIIMATKEKHAPYDKSKLSKVSEDIYLRKPEFLCAHGIELWTEKEVQKQLRSVLSGWFCSCHGEGIDVNVCHLQTPEDSSKVLELASGKNLVIVGASFIDLFLSGRGKDSPGGGCRFLLAADLPGTYKAAAMSVVDKEEFPFQKTLGPQIGGFVLKMLQSKGVKFYMKKELHELKGKDGKVSHATEVSELLFLGDTPLKLRCIPVPMSRLSPPTSRPSCFLAQSTHMQTNIPNVFAAGDVVSFPVALLNGEHSSIHHQQVAEAHGSIAAFNMLKKQKELHTVPFFWTTMLGRSIHYAGRMGQREKKRAQLSLSKAGRNLGPHGFVTAAASLNCDPTVSLIAEVLYLGKRISKEEAE